MAIYKPTDCSPSFQPIDLQDIINGKPYYFYCKIQSSNVQSGLSVSGYTIEIYDENGKLVFPTEDSELSNRISVINDLNSLNIDPENYTRLNSGINGTYLKIPVLTDSKADDDNTVGRNQILITDLPGGIIENNKNYTWKITLYQGIEKSGERVSIPSVATQSSKFDMLVTSGQVLGSDKERIQSKISENIYPNYFIQPVFLTAKEYDEGELITTQNILNESFSYFDKKNQQIIWSPDDRSQPISSITPIGKRALISSYDYSFGHIYPYFGANGLSDSQIGKGKWKTSTANAFCIYKNSNDPSLFSQYNKVNRYASRPAGEIKWLEGSFSNEGLKTFTQSIPMRQSDYDNLGGNLPFYVESTVGYDNGGKWDISIDGDSSTDGDSRTVFPKEGRILFGKMKKTYAWRDDDDGSTTSPLNGIYSVQDQRDFKFDYDVWEEETSYEQGRIVRYKGHDWEVRPQGGTQGTPPDLFPTDWRDKGSSKGTLILTWARTSDANTWGNLITKIVLCEQNLVNYQFAQYKDDGKIILNPEEIGYINQTPMTVILEEPIELWSVENSQISIGDDGNIVHSPEYQASIYGKIFYNEVFSDEEGLFYISPFKYLNKNNAFLSKFGNFLISDFDAEYSKVYLSAPSTEETEEIDGLSIGAQYEIKTFFREGNETVFYTAPSPKIEFEFKTDFGETITLDEENPTMMRENFHVIANYSHDNYISWDSYQFELFIKEEDEYKLVYQDDFKYSGALEGCFSGLLNLEDYLLRLNITTQNGQRISKDFKFATFLGLADVSTYFNFDISFNCLTNSTNMKVERKDTPGVEKFKNFSIYKREIWNGEKEMFYHPVALNIPFEEDIKTIQEVTDYHIANKRKYEYVFRPHHDITRLQPQIIIPISFSWDFWSLTELHPTDDPKIFLASEEGVWLFKYNVTSTEQTQNISKTQQDNLGRYPVFTRGRKNNMSSSVSALIGQEIIPYRKTGSYKESSPFLKRVSSNEEIDIINKWRDICYSGNPKLLKDMKGQEFLVQITDNPSNNINYSWSQMPNTISFNWVQIGNLDNVQIYNTKIKETKE